MGAYLRAGGCVRFTNSGPVWHENASHITMGINKASLAISATGDLEFTLTGTEPVVAAVANPDETLVVRGISAGISGGVNLCVVRFRSDDKGGRLDLSRTADYNLIKGEYSNLWVAIFAAER